MTRGPGPDPGFDRGDWAETISGTVQKPCAHGRNDQRPTLSGFTNLGGGGRSLRRMWAATAAPAGDMSALAGSDAGQRHGDAGRQYGNAPENLLA